ncbi:MAG TPA: DUF1275 domain-containing protein [Lachnospiraceae bacterium]|jgi:uncharacterized membrane protein YoaK (UPF0700 family)|nr:DUF1275 domain-containing protein [Lachnospiraceae bacterium]
MNLLGKGFWNRHTDTLLHWAMACYGGFAGLFSIVLHEEVFANAVTGNLMALTRNLVGHDFFTVGLRILATLIFALGAVVVYLLDTYSSVDVRRFSIILNAACISLSILLTPRCNAIIALYPMFFAATVQWTAFGKVEGYASSTLFCSNNTKQAAVGFAQFCIGHEKAMLWKAIIYAGSVAAYVVGGVAAVLCVNRYGAVGAIGAYALLSGAMVLHQIRCVKEHQETLRLAALAQAKELAQTQEFVA